jgi:hypothetical protein
MQWRKSSFSDGTGACVEVAVDGETVYIRDTKAPEAGTLALSATSWRDLLDAAKAGELDDMA